MSLDGGADDLWGRAEGADAPQDIDDEDAGASLEGRPADRRGFLPELVWSAPEDRNASVETASGDGPETDEGAGSSEAVYLGTGYSAEVAWRDDAGAAADDLSDGYSDRSGEQASFEPGGVPWQDGETWSAEAAEAAGIASPSVLEFAEPDGNEAPPAGQSSSGDAGDRELSPGADDFDTPAQAGFEDPSSGQSEIASGYQQPDEGAAPRWEDSETQSATGEAFSGDTPGLSDDRAQSPDNMYGADDAARARPAEWNGEDESGSETDRSSFLARALARVLGSAPRGGEPRPDVRAGAENGIDDHTDDITPLDDRLDDAQAVQASGGGAGVDGIDADAGQIHATQPDPEPEASEPEIPEMAPAASAGPMPEPSPAVVPEPADEPVGIFAVEEQGDEEPAFNLFVDPPDEIRDAAPERGVPSPADLPWRRAPEPARMAEQTETVPLTGAYGSSSEDGEALRSAREAAAAAMQRAGLRRDPRPQAPATPPDGAAIPAPGAPERYGAALRGPDPDGSADVGDTEHFDDPAPSGSAGFAAMIDAQTVPELLTASAAYLTIGQGRSRFTRREVMDVFDGLPGDQPRSLEARIKGFGRLVREGTLVLVEDGVFAMSQSARERFER